MTDIAAVIANTPLDAGEGTSSATARAERLTVELSERDAQLAARTLELDTLCEITGKIGRSLTFREVFEVLLVQSRTAVPYDVAAGLLFEGASNCLYLSQVRRLADVARAEVEQRLHDAAEKIVGVATDGEFSRVVELSAPATAEGETAPSGAEPLEAPLAFFQVPMLTDRGPAGVLLLGAASESAFDERHIQLMYALCRQAAIVVERLQDVVRRERQRVQTVVDNLPSGVALLDEEGVVEAVNPVGRLLLKEAAGAGPGDVLRHLAGRDLTDLPDRDAVHLHLKTRQGEDPQDGASSRDGETGRVLRVELIPIAGTAGGGRMLTLQDVTADYQEQAELARMNAELERRVDQRTVELKVRANQLARLASELTLTEQRERRRLAEILHDHLQQMLVGANYELGSLPGPSNEEQKTRLQNVSTTLNAAIEVSRSLTVELCPPVLHDAGLAAALAWLGRFFARQHGMAVVVQADEKADPGRADLRSLLFQSARELLFNAKKYSGVSKAEVRLTVDQKSGIRLTVSDAGRGFDPAETFQTADRNGGGFGLFSVRERLALLGGSMSVRSAPGTGAVFELTVPRVAPADQGLLNSPEDASSPDATFPDQASSPDKRTRVLLIDDHAVIRRSVQILIENEPDFVVVGEAGNGHEGVRQALALEPDVILMDFTMPKLNGVEATRRITAALPGVLVIGLSTHHDGERADAMLEAGAVAFLPKNSTPEYLIGTLRSVCATSDASSRV